MSKKKDNVKYVGKTPCEIPGTNTGLIKPGQTLSLPQNMADNLVLDKNWEPIGAAETPALPGTKKEKKETPKEKKGGK